MPATTYFKGLVLGHALRQQPFSIEDWYVGLWTTDPTASGALSGEISASDYERKPVSWASDFTNTSLIEWPPATTNWGTISYLALMNSPNKGQGNMLGYSTVGPFTVEIGRPLEIPAGGLITDLI